MRTLVTVAVLVLAGPLPADKTDPIHDAARNGDVARVKELLKSKPGCINAVEEHPIPSYRDGFTPLHWAVYRRHAVVVEVLLAHGADVRVKDAGGHTPLHLAAATGQKDVVRMLLARKADLTAEDRGGYTHLQAAVWAGQKEAAELLLAGGARLDLFSASGMGNFGRVRADLRVAPELARTKDGRKRTLLHWAAHGGRNALAEFLLARNVDVNARDEEGSTPLAEATRAGHVELVRLLLAHRADPDIAERGENMAPLHWAVQGNHKAVAELLLAGKANVNSKDGDGKTPLHHSAARGQEGMVRLLLANKATVNARADLLMPRPNAPLWANPSDVTPLHLAASRGHEGAVRILLEAHAEVNAKDSRGRTPLAWASGHKTVAKLLRDKGGKE